MRALRPPPEPQAAVPHRKEIKKNVDVPDPPFFGTRVLERSDFRALIPFINENALFKVQWQFKPQKRKPQEYQAYLEAEVKPIFKRMIEHCEREGLILPKAVYGYFRCNSDGDDLIVYHPDTGAEMERFTFPRQQGKKELCISDFFRPAKAKKRDVVAFMAVTVGKKVGEVEHRLFAEHKYTDYLYLHGMGVESAEALAEIVHRQIRAEMDIHRDDAREIVKLFHQHYRGSRYSFGYPACPNLEDQAKLLRLLDAGRIGISLTEGFLLEPEQSTTAIVVHHEQAKYFNV